MAFRAIYAQASALDSLLAEMERPLQRAVLMDLDFRILLNRLSGRSTCRACDKVANIHHPAFDPDETCPGTGRSHEYFQRDDDNEETISKRLEVYRAQTEPLVAFYRDQGKLVSVDAEGSIEAVQERLGSALEMLSRAGLDDTLSKGAEVSET